MQFTTLAASLVAIAGLSAASPLQARGDDTCPVQKGDAIWEISKFSIRMRDDKKISSIQFNIKGTNGGLYLDCSASPDSIDNGEWYGCSEYASTFFAYDSEGSRLLIQHSVDDNKQQVGTTTLHLRGGHAAGEHAGSVDTIFEDDHPSFITMIEYKGLQKPKNVRNRGDNK